MEVRRSVNPVFAQDFAGDIAAAFLVAPVQELFDTPIVHLWQDEAFMPTAATPLADFTAAVANYTGYAGEALVMTVPHNLGPDVEGAAGTVQFDSAAPVPPAVFVPNTIYGYWVQGVGGLYMFERFAEGQSVNIGEVGDSLVLVVTPGIRHQIGPLEE